MKCIECECVNVRRECEYDVVEVVLCVCELIGKMEY